ncbi:putative transport protein HsrA [Sodalis praecaptivus]|nr:putative transport protein HsrA [Sodalis praecaptivus]
MARSKQAPTAQHDETSSESDTSPQHATKGISGMALLVAGAFFIEYLDGTVIATALPQMARDFGVAAVDLNIGMSAYLITLAVLIPVSGWTADPYGARNIFGAALLIFTLSSFLCGLTQNVGEFIAMRRVVQGIGGAMMVPVGRLAVLRNTPKNQLIVAIATLTWPALVAPILGPPLGGFITSYASWRWIFFINIPLGIAAMIIAWILIPNVSENKPQPFDKMGFVSMGLAMLCLVTALELCSQLPVNWPAVWLLLAVGLLALVIALRHLRRARYPMVRLDALRIHMFRITMGGGMLFRITVSSVPFLLPLLFQVGFGMDPFHAGILVLAVFAGNLAMKPATTPLMRRFGFRPILLVNGALCVLSLLVCATFTPDTSPAWVMLMLFWGGLCRSMQFTGISSLAFADVPAGEMSSANTLFSTALQLSAGLGITLGALAVRAGELIARHSGLDAIPGIAFRLAFVFIALVTAVGLIDLLRLPANAGDGVARKTPNRK